MTDPLDDVGMLDVDGTVTQLETALSAAGNADRAVQEKRYLKSTRTHYGVGVPLVRSTVRTALRDLGPLSAEDAVALAGQLWQQPVHELRTAAVEVLAASVRRLRMVDLAVVERMLREAGTWALADPLATAVVAPVVERELDRDPGLRALLDQWAQDDDFWVRRAALLALLPGLRAGAGHFELFARYAEWMLDEREFFIRKAIGWVLRDTAKRRPELVADWVRRHRARLSRLSLREAVKYLPPEDRADLLAGG